MGGRTDGAALVLLRRRVRRAMSSLTVFDTASASVGPSTDSVWGRADFLILPSGLADRLTLGRGGARCSVRCGLCGGVNPATRGPVAEPPVGDSKSEFRGDHGGVSRRVVDVKAGELDVDGLYPESRFGGVGSGGSGAMGAFRSNGGGRCGVLLDDMMTSWLIPKSLRCDGGAYGGELR